jgi:hypothetical protein
MMHPEELLAGYEDGSLSDEDRAAVEAHLAACEACRREVEMARRAVTALAALGEEPVPLGLMNRVTSEIGRRTRRPAPRQARFRWVAGLAAAAAIVALLAVRPPHMLGGGGGAGSAAMSAASPELGRGPTAESAEAVGLEVQRVDYDIPRLEALAADVATRVKSGQTAIPAPSSPAPRDATLAALDCLGHALPEGPSPAANDRLVRLIEARFQGTPAYLEVSVEGPGSGRPPDQVVIWVVAQEDCSILSFSSKRIP